MPIIQWHIVRYEQYSDRSDVACTRVIDICCRTIYASQCIKTMYHQRCSTLRAIQLGVGKTTRPNFYATTSNRRVVSSAFRRQAFIFWLHLLHLCTYMRNSSVTFLTSREGKAPDVPKATLNWTTSHTRQLIKYSGDYRQYSNGYPGPAQFMLLSFTLRLGFITVITSSVHFLLRQSLPPFPNDFSPRLPPFSDNKPQSLLVRPSFKSQLPLRRRFFTLTFPLILLSSLLVIRPLCLIVS